jgi:hypothetical protein
MEKKKDYQIRLPIETRQSLEALAIDYDYMRGDIPCVSRMIAAIAKGNLQIVDKNDEISATLNHQHSTDIDSSFRSQLIIAIAQGLSANTAIAEYSANQFADKVFERVKSIMGDDSEDESVYAEDFL